MYTITNIYFLQAYNMWRVKGNDFNTKGKVTDLAYMHSFRKYSNYTLECSSIYVHFLYLYCSWTAGLTAVCAQAVLMHMPWFNSGDLRGVAQVKNRNSERWFQLGRSFGANWL